MSHDTRAFPRGRMGDRRRLSSQHASSLIGMRRVMCAPRSCNLARLGSSTHMLPGVRHRSLMAVATPNTLWWLHSCWRFSLRLGSGRPHLRFRRQLFLSATTSIRSESARGTGRHQHLHSSAWGPLVMAPRRGMRHPLDNRGSG
jgi:hypothetical protein